MMKVHFFQVASIFSGADNLDHFWLGHWGQKLLPYACQGQKFAYEIPLGGNLGGQVENVCPLGLG